MNDTSNSRYRYTLPYYNGFSHAERVATLPVQNGAFRNGTLARPIACSICGFSRPEELKGSGYIFSHLEDYRRPLDILPCCKRCHAALHARFREPQRWLQILDRHARPDQWFMSLSMNPQSQFVPFDETYPQGLPKWPNADHRLTLPMENQDAAL